jgi:hypothetical protein
MASRHKKVADVEVAQGSNGAAMKIDSSRPRPGRVACVIGLGQTEDETRLRPGRILTEPPDGPKHAAKLVSDEEMASSRPRRIL